MTSSIIARSALSLLAMFIGAAAPAPHVMGSGAVAKGYVGQRHSIATVVSQGAGESATGGFESLQGASAIEQPTADKKESSRIQADLSGRLVLHVELLLRSTRLGPSRDPGKKRANGKDIEFELTGLDASTTTGESIRFFALRTRDNTPVGFLDVRSDFAKGLTPCRSVFALPEPIGLPKEPGPKQSAWIGPIDRALRQLHVIVALSDGIYEFDLALLRPPPGAMQEPLTLVSSGQAASPTLVSCGGMMVGTVRVSDKPSEHVTRFAAMTLEATFKRDAALFQQAKAAADNYIHMPWSSTCTSCDGEKYVRDPSNESMSRRDGVRVEYKVRCPSCLGRGKVRPEKAHEAASEAVHRFAALRSRIGLWAAAAADAAGTPFKVPEHTNVRRSVEAVPTRIIESSVLAGDRARAHLAQCEAAEAALATLTLAAEGTGNDGSHVRPTGSTPTSGDRSNDNVTQMDGNGRPTMVTLSRDENWVFAEPLVELCAMGVWRMSVESSFQRAATGHGDWLQPRSYRPASVQLLGDDTRKETVALPPEPFAQMDLRVEEEEHQEGDDNRARRKQGRRFLAGTSDS